MLKIVVYDGGYGGELFADRLEETLPVAEVIRVIDWRNAEKLQKSPHAARQIALDSLRAYIGRVDLIIFANYLLSVTSLKYFRRKFKNQKFLGLTLPHLNNNFTRPVIILTTKPLTKTISYHNYLFRLKREARTIYLDTWPKLIDDGELTDAMVYRSLTSLGSFNKRLSADLILICSQFSDAKPLLRRALGNNIGIHDGFANTIDDACKILKIRGGTGKKKKK